MLAKLSSDTPMVRSWFQPTPDSYWTRTKDKRRLRVANLFHLVWTIYVFADLLFGQDIPPHWIPATAVSFPLFLLLYAGAQIRPVRYMEWFGLCMAVLGLVTMKFNHSGGACYVIYACAFMGVNGGLRVGLLRMLGIIAVFALVANLGLDLPWSAVGMLALIAFSVGSINMIYRTNSQRDAELKLSHDEVRRLAATAERERIGRDLHDLLGHTLSLITLKLELSRRLIDRDTDAARREIEEAEGVARHALAEVRSAVTGIRSTGIAAELASARLLLNSSMVSFDYVSDLPALPERVESGLALVLREAVTNIHRHARASVAEAKVTLEGHALMLCITDNGVGGVAAEGNGLCGMRERVRDLGGTLVIDSARGKGTRLRVAVPLLAAERLPPTLTPLPETTA